MKEGSYWNRSESEVWADGVTEEKMERKGIRKYGGGVLLCQSIVLEHSLNPQTASPEVWKGIMLYQEYLSDNQVS